MIKAELKKKNEEIIGFKISGHANYDVKGQDIVCAGISMLVFNTIDAVTDLLNLEDYIEYQINDNEIYLYLIKELDDTQKKNFELIMRKLELGIISTIRSYKDYIELHYMEV